MSEHKSSLGFLTASPAAPRVQESRVASLYKKYRASAFLGIFIGYAGFYLIRNNVHVVEMFSQI